SNSWLQAADFGGGPRVESVTFTIGASGYLGTGWDGVSFRKDFWEYKPGEISTSSANLQTTDVVASIHPNPVRDDAEISINQSVALLHAKVNVVDSRGRIV